MTRNIRPLNVSFLSSVPEISELFKAAGIQPDTVFLTLDKLSLCTVSSHVKGNWNKVDQTRLGSYVACKAQIIYRQNTEVHLIHQFYFVNIQTH